MSDSERKAAAEREEAQRRSGGEREPTTGLQRRAFEQNEKRGNEARERLEEMREKRAEMEAERDEAFGERDRLFNESQAVERQLWPYYGLFPEPMHVQLHVIPAGMWRYQVPQTPAEESMVPPSIEADPNYAIVAMSLGIPPVDTQSPDDLAARWRAEQADALEQRLQASPPPMMPTREQRASAQRQEHEHGGTQRQGRGEHNAPGAQTHPPPNPRAPHPTA